MSAMDLLCEPKTLVAEIGKLFSKVATFAILAMQHSPFLFCNFRYLYYAINTDIVNTVLSVKEKGTRELLQEAINLHRSHNLNAARNSVKTLWDAFERMKTYYKDLDKQQSANRIVADMAGGSDDYKKLLDEEFDKLTKIGNNFRIRHHETNKIEITDVRYYDYFFNRCLSLIALAVQYLE